MKFFSPTSILAATFIAALLAGCGPGTPGDETDEPAPPAPEWAFGWWMSPSGLGDDFQWGAYILQMEIRPDGTVFQIADYCKGEDWTHESRWELQSDGSIRIVPKAGDDGVPFQHYTSVDYDYIEIRPSDGSCTTSVVRVREDFQSETTIERGRWCIGAYDESINDCPLQKYCGEEAPVCE
jgi:hypothetical protein